VVLILAIFAVALLLVLAIGLSAAVRGELLASRVSFDRAQSLFLAQAGLNVARAILLYDDPTVDTLEDDWGPEAAEPLDLPLELPAGACRVRVYDACGRIDVNTASLETLAKLTGSVALAQAIVDWRELGSDEQYYRSLPYPYAPRRGRFQTAAELLLVKDITPAVYFGTVEQPGLVDLVTVASASPNTSAEGRLRTSVNSIQGTYGALLGGDPEALQRWFTSVFGESLSMYEVQDIMTKLDAGARHTTAGVGYTSLSQLATLAGLSDSEITAIIDQICITPGTIISGKVNVNTASPEVLAALPGSTTSLAETLVRQRDQQPLLSLAEVVALLFAQGDGRRAFEQGMVDALTTKSSSFIVESTGYSENGRGYRSLRALVYRDLGPDLRTPTRVPVFHQVEQDWPLPPLEAAAAPAAGLRRSGSAPS
jgi:type II secretory pathway component PulK